MVLFEYLYRSVDIGRTSMEDDWEGQWSSFKSHMIDHSNNNLVTFEIEESEECCEVHGLDWPPYPYHTYTI